MELSEALELVKKITWQYLVNRAESPLMSSITDNGYDQFESTTGIPWKATKILRLGNGELHHCKKELQALQTYFEKGGINFLTQFKKRLIEYITAFDRTAAEIKTVDCTILSQKELEELIQRFLECAFAAHNFLLPMPIADKVLSSLLLNKLPSVSEEQKQQWLLTLTFPEKENSHITEERSFYNLVLSHKNKKEFSFLLQKHLENFAWIGARWYWWDKAWKEEDLLTRIQFFIGQKLNTKKKLEHLEKVQQEQEIAARNLQKKLKIQEKTELFQLLEIAREFSYLRTWRTDIIYKAGYNTRNLVYEAAKRGNLPKEDITYLSYQEIQKLLKTKEQPLSRTEIEKRKESATKLTFNGTYTIFAGKEIENKFKSILYNDLENPREIKGNTAYPGKVKGKAKIVLETNDLSHVKPGDILIAVMTFPHFIPAMEKAAAFVTDEGGILCHAAIISREMQKPCIIATKNATKILKNGDFVEVDADKRIVRKIDDTATAK